MNTLRECARVPLKGGGPPMAEAEVAPFAILRASSRVSSLAADRRHDGFHQFCGSTRNGPL